MKKILVYIFSLIVLAGCEKEKVDLTFGSQPEVRIEERLTELRTLLTSSENGWNASLNTLGKGGYGFYLDFQDGKSISMVSDLTDETSLKANTSTYRVIWAMDASLVFDTFNYITMLQEPSGSFGGTAPDGYKSDIEFQFLKQSGDSVYFVGKKYQQPLVLTKATAAQKKAYLEDVLGKKKLEMTQFLNSHYNNFVTVEGIKNNISVGFSNTSKTFTLQFVNEENVVESLTGKFHYSASDIIFSQPVTVNGVTLTRANLQQDKLSLFDESGKSYAVQQSAQPVLAVETLYGYNRSYKSFGSKAETNTIPEVLISSTFPSILNTVTNNFGTVKFRYFTIKFESKSKLTVNVYYMSSANFTATMTVDYVYENGIITLSNPTGNTSGNWNTRRSAIRPLEDYILNNKSFKVIWVDNEAGIPVIGWQSVNNPNDVIYGFPSE